MHPTYARPRTILTAILASTISFFWGCGESSPTADSEVPFEPGPSYQPMEPIEKDLIQPNPLEAVVVIDDGVDVEALAAALELTVIEVTDANDGTLARFRIPEGYDLTDLRAAAGVNSADRNVAIDIAESQTLVLGFFEGTWDSESVGSQAWMRVLKMWGLHSRGTGEGKIIAVLDTGAYLPHPAIAGHARELPENHAFTSWEYRDHIDNDGDGQLDEAFGHGTHVAGSVAMMAPGATILPIRVLTDDGVGSLWDIVYGIHYARQYGADVINLSLSLSENNSTLEQLLQACHDDGIAVVAAAGNNGPDNPRYPATSPYAIGVASVGLYGDLSTFSGAGDQITFAAPGEEILSAYPRAETWSGSGTSMATPLVSGAIAVVSEALGIGPLAAAEALDRHAVRINPTNAVTSGRIDPLEAIQRSRP